MGPRPHEPAAAGYWTVVAESEVEDVGAGYMDLVTGGRRELFKLE